MQCADLRTNSFVRRTLPIDQPSKETIYSKPAKYSLGFLLPTEIGTQLTPAHPLQFIFYAASPGSTMTWADLFERATEYETSLATIREVVERVDETQHE